MAATSRTSVCRRAMVASSLTASSTACVPGFDHRSVGEHQLQRYHRVAGRPVLQPMAPRSIQSQHAPHRRHAAGRRVRAKDPAAVGQEAIELRQHHSRLDTHSLLVAGQNTSHGMGEIQNQARPQRFTRQSGSRSPRVQRDLVLHRVLHAGHNIGRVSRSHHPQRTDLINTGIRGIHLHKHVVATDVTVQ